MPSVPPAIALRALGEDASIMPAQPPGAPAVDTRAIVGRERYPTEDGVTFIRAMTVWMAATPAYAIHDRIRIRGADWTIQSIHYDDDPAWVVYYLRPAN